MKICVITDDNAAFSKEEAKKLNLRIVRMPIIVNGETKFEGDNFTKDEFYKDLENNVDISTSQPAPGEILALWDDVLKDYDQIIHIPMTSGLSEECNTAKMLAKDYEGKVFVVDNHRISVTLKSSVYDALKLIKEGYKAEEIKKILEDEGFASSIYIMVDTLKYLKKGGRVTPAGALLGSAIHLKPILSIFGYKLDAYKKAIGTKKAKLLMIEAIKNDIENKFKDIPKANLVFGMAYTHDYEEIKIFKSEMLKALKLKDKDVTVDELSLSIATHIGPGSLAITVSKKV